jgi:hypothetical protein
MRGSEDSLAGLEVILLRDEVPHGLPECLLFRAELEVHRF